MNSSCSEYQLQKEEKIWITDVLRKGKIRMTGELRSALISTSKADLAELPILP